MSRNRRSKIPSPPVACPFQIGDSVAVAPGVRDPDDPAHSIAGWQGRVIEIHSKAGTVSIAWDSQTLQSMPESMIADCEEEGLDWSVMGLHFHELQPATERDMPAAREQVKKAIERDHAWIGLGPMGRRIQKVLTGIDPKDVTALQRAWRTHLQAALKFPFQAELAASRGPFRAGTKVLVTGIDKDVLDDDYGLIAELGGDWAGYAYPLCDLEVIGKQDPNHDLIHEYAFWFSNH